MEALLNDLREIRRIFLEVYIKLTLPQKIDEVAKYLSKVLTTKRSPFYGSPKKDL